MCECVEIVNAKENDSFGVRLSLALDPYPLVILSISSRGIEYPLASLSPICHSYSRIPVQSPLNVHPNNVGVIHSQMLEHNNIA